MPPRATPFPNCPTRRPFLCGLAGGSVLLALLGGPASAGALAPADLEDRARFYDAIYSLSHEPINQAPSPFVVRMLDRLSPPTRLPPRALDIGSGNGRHSIYAAQKGFAVTAVDISPVGLAQTRLKADALQLPVQTLQADIHQFDLGDRTWDLILLVDFPFDTETLLPKIRQALKPGGLLILKVVSTAQAHEPDELIAYRFMDRSRLHQSVSEFETLHDSEGPTPTLWGVQKIMALYAGRKPRQGS